MNAPAEAHAVEPFAAEVQRDVIRVSGPDAVSFLQGQLSQDVASLRIDTSAWTFLLQPQGKVDAWLRMTRTADDAVLLDVDGGWGDAVVARLERFKLRTKADLEPLPWRCVALRGAIDGDSSLSGSGLSLDAAWPGVTAVDLIGPDAHAPAGVRVGTADELDALRIECGIPAMGRELTERTIPAEAGVVERSVSFTKGCYTGQELVARIDSRGGNVPRRLRGIILDGRDLPDAGEVVRVEGDDVGVLTSVAWSPRFEAPVALAYVKRDVEAPVAGAVGGVVARIELLPLVRSEV